MAVREFTDSKGTEWRVWDVTPEHMHPATRSEDYMSNLQDGWLAFESATEKRRLAAPYPSDWTSYRIPELEALCARAKAATRRTLQSDTGKRRAEVARESEQVAMRSANAQRTFRSPRGASGRSASTNASTARAPTRWFSASPPTTSSSS